MRAIDHIAIGRGVTWPRLLGEPQPNWQLSAAAIYSGARVGPVIDVTAVEDFIEAHLEDVVNTRPTQEAMDRAFHDDNAQATYLVAPPFSQFVLRTRCKAERAEKLGFVVVQERAADGWNHLPAAVRWAYHMQILVAAEGWPQPQAVGQVTWFADDAGELIVMWPTQMGLNRFKGREDVVQSDNLALLSLHMMERVALTALTFMNCKNVLLREEAEASKLARKFQAKHGRSRVRYHVLDIRPMTSVIHREAPAGSTSLAKALHVCRGHLKDYRERPLFGKVKGLFYWSPHLRGQAEQGTVDKDYRVRAPEEQP